MILVDEVRERIEAAVPALAGLMGNAGEFTRLVAENRYPQKDKYGFVLPGRLAGRTGDTATGLFRQLYDQTISVVMMVRVANDATGSGALDEMSPLIGDVVKAVAGWGPEDAIGVFDLASGELVGTEAGRLIYQLDFTIQDQLRIAG